MGHPTCTTRIYCRLSSGFVMKPETVATDSRKLTIERTALCYHNIWGKSYGNITNYQTLIVKPCFNV